MNVLKPHMDCWISYLIWTEKLKLILSIKDWIFQKFNVQNYYFWKETHFCTYKKYWTGGDTQQEAVSPRTVGACSFDGYKHNLSPENDLSIEVFIKSKHLKIWDPI